MALHSCRQAFRYSYYVGFNAHNFRHGSATRRVSITFDTGRYFHHIKYCIDDTQLIRHFVMLFICVAQHFVKVDGKVIPRDDIRWTLREVA